MNKFGVAFFSAAALGVQGLQLQSLPSGTRSSPSQGQQDDLTQVQHRIWLEHKNFMTHLAKRQLEEYDKSDDEAKSRTYAFAESMLDEVRDLDEALADPLISKKVEDHLKSMLKLGEDLKELQYEREKGSQYSVVRRQLHLGELLLRIDDKLNEYGDSEHRGIFETLKSHTEAQIEDGLMWAKGAFRTQLTWSHALLEFELLKRNPNVADSEVNEALDQQEYQELFRNMAFDLYEDPNLSIFTDDPDSENEVINNLKSMHLKWFYQERARVVHE